MATEPFSKRYGFRRAPEELMHDNVPISVRVGLLEILDQIRIETQKGPVAIQMVISNSLRVKRWSHTFAWNQVDKLVHQCEWYSLYDICESVYTYLMSPVNDSSITAGAFETMLNDVLSEEGMGYKMQNGSIERVSAPFIDKYIQEVRQLLRNSRFEGPNMHFEKAIGFLNQRPSPDTENCIKEAASALEAIGRILSGEHEESFGTIYKTHFKVQIPAPLNLIFEKFWGYASNEEGIRHGSTGDSRVLIEEAELCLVQAASMIRYLVQKFGHNLGDI